MQETIDGAAKIVQVADGVTLTSALVLMLVLSLTALFFAAKLLYRCMQEQTSTAQIGARAMERAATATEASAEALRNLQLAQKALVAAVLRLQARIKAAGE